MSNSNPSPYGYKSLAVQNFTRFNFALDPKHQLQRAKIAHDLTESLCPWRQDFISQIPRFLDEPWSKTMNEPYTYICKG